jgi:hypothetical protein
MATLRRSPSQDDDLARSWDPARSRRLLAGQQQSQQPGLFSEGSFRLQAGAEELFRPPNERIDEWLQGRRDDLSEQDAQCDRDLMYLLLENRSFGYPGTDGTLLSNYVAYCLNRHPLLSILTAHPLHPFTRAERLVVLTCSFCWAFLVKAMIHHQPLGVMPWYVFYTVVALLVLPYEVLIRVFAVCACVQYDESERGHVRRRRWLRCGRVVLGTLTAINVAMLSYGVWTTLSIKRVEPYSLLRHSWSTILAKLWALAVWFPLWLPVFLLWYNNHKAAWLAAHPAGHPCHVCATSTEDGGTSALYWLLVTGRPHAPPVPRVSKDFAPDPVCHLPIVDTRALTVRMPTRSRSDNSTVTDAHAATDGDALEPPGGKHKRAAGAPRSPAQSVRTTRDATPPTFRPQPVRGDTASTQTATANLASGRASPSDGRVMQMV